MDKKRFCIIENNELWGRPLVLDLHTKIVGNPYILEYSQQDAINEQLHTLANEEIPMAKVPGYSIFFTIRFCLTDEKFSDNVVKEVLTEMSRFFLEYRIDNKPGRYYKSRDDYYQGCLNEKSSWTHDQIAEKQRRKRIKRGEL